MPELTAAGPMGTSTCPTDDIWPTATSGFPTPVPSVRLLPDQDQLTQQTETDRQEAIEPQFAEDSRAQWEQANEAARASYIRDRSSNGVEAPLPGTAQGQEVVYGCWVGAAALPRTASVTLQMIAQKVGLAPRDFTVPSFFVEDKAEADPRDLVYSEQAGDTMLGGNIGLGHYVEEGDTHMEDNTHMESDTHMGGDTPMGVDGM